MRDRVRSWVRLGGRATRVAPWRRRGLGRIGVCLIVSLVGLGAACRPIPPGTLIWSDEFNAPAGTLPKSSNWTLRTGGRWSGGRELQCYTRRPQNISHDGRGSLRITARYEPGNRFCSDGPNNYTSGRIDSRDKREFRYGTVQARIKLPRGAGTWPAFWMLGDTAPGLPAWPAIGEVDILEAKGIEPKKAHHALHGATNGGSHWQRSTDTLGADWTAGWHVYGIRWSANRIEYQIDGVTRYVLTRGSIPSNAQWVFNRQFHLLLNMAVGDWGGRPNPSHYPRELLVDWVRVHQGSSRPR